MKKLCFAFLFLFSLSCVAEDANISSQTLILDIPVVNVDGNPSFINLQLRFRSDGLFEIVGLSPYVEPVVEPSNNPFRYGTHIRI